MQHLWQPLCGVMAFNPNNRQLGAGGSLSTQLHAQGTTGKDVWKGFLSGARQWDTALPTEFL